jgi:hypothetical protein
MGNKLSIFSLKRFLIAASGSNLQSENAILKQWWLLPTAICLLIVTLFSIACKIANNSETPHDRSQQDLAKVLSGFEFIESGNLALSQNRSKEENTLLKHDKVTKPLPLNLKAGTQYILHYNSVASNNQLFGLLQQRLLDQGYVIKPSDGLTNRYLGGLSFRISFSRGSVEGFIYNTLDGDLLTDPNRPGEWPSDDYVLVIQRVSPSD